jgi:hypothetical protein
MTDDPGLLGNLPRSRVGRRSPKRDSPPAREKQTRERPGEPDSDPVGDALRLAGRTAQTGARVASDLTRELLRRLPRP